MGKSKEQTDSFRKAVADVVAVKREMARKEKIVRDAELKQRSVLRGAFRGMVREYDSLEKGLRILKPILGDIGMSPYALLKAEFPKELKNALIAVASAIDHPDLNLQVQAKVSMDHIRSLRLAFALGDVEKASLSLDITKASEAVDVRFIMNPITSFDSQDAVKTFNNWVNFNKHGQKAYEHRVTAGLSLIQFVKSQAEARALTFKTAHTSGAASAES